MNQLTTAPLRADLQFAPDCYLSVGPGQRMPGGRVLEALAGDLTQDNHFGVAYLILFEQDLVVAEAGTDEARTNYTSYITLSLADIDKVYVLEKFGIASMFAVTRNGEHKLLSFSKSCVNGFIQFAQLINHTIETGTFSHKHPLDAHYCEGCGFPLLQDQSCQVCFRKTGVLKRLMKLVKPFRNQLLLIVILTFVAVAAQMATPFITKHIVDDVIVAKNTGPLFFWISAMLVAGVVFLLARWAIDVLAAWFSTRLVAELRARLHAHLQTIKIDYFHKRSAGEIISRVMQDTTDIQQFIYEGLPFLLVNTFSLIAIAVVLVSLDVWLALMVFIPVPIVGYTTYRIWKRLYPMMLQRNSYRGRLNSVLTESVMGVKAVKAAGREKTREQQFANSNEKFFQAVFRVMRDFSVFAESSYWIMSLGAAAVWLVASIRLASSDTSLTMGILLAFVGYIWLFYAPLQWFSVILNWMNNALAGTERVLSILDIKPEVYQPENVLVNPRIKGAIEFDKVSFSYEDGKPVLKDIELTIQPGEMIGLVGRSGAGKSTIINLLCRYYEADKGLIRIDGQPIDRYALTDLRRSIGIVMQEPFIFQGSILENIRYSKPEADFEQVIAAAKAAHAHEFIVDKEAAYDSVIGENGVQLSGGERQRIAIARAILQDPKILILDEATSLVDTETEQKIQQAMNRLVQGRTTIAIAHRLATLRNANRLVVIDDGKIAEVGTHSELLKRSDGIYAGLVRAQAEMNQARSETVVA